MTQSRLPSLLVQDSAASSRDIERALRVQVLRGGGLDTALLELGAIAEPLLIEFLSMASGLPAAEPADFREVNSEIAEACSAELSEKFSVCPAYLDDSSLCILVSEPVDLASLEDLATELGMALRPLVTTEYRYQLTRARIYGGSADDRFSKLDRDAIPEVSEASRTERVIVDAKRAVEPSNSDRPTEVMEAVDVAPEDEPSPRRTLEHAAVPAPTAEDEAAESDDDADDNAPASEDSTSAAGSPDDGDSDSDEDSDSDGDSSDENVDPEEASAHANSPDKLEPSHALAALAAADSRDEIFDVLLRGIRSRAGYAALLTVQNNVAAGRSARSIDSLSKGDVEAVKVDLDLESPYKRACDSGAPVIGPLGSGNPDIDAMTAKMGGVVPQAAMLMPIFLRGRAVALAVAHSGKKTRWVSRASDILPLAKATGEAFSRILVKAKGGAKPVTENDANSDDPPEAAAKKKAQR